MKALKSILVLAIVAVTVAFTTKSKGGYAIGDKVDNFTLKNIDGKMVSLNDYKGDKGVILVFTCNHCPYSKMYEDRIIALDKKYKSKGYPVVAINPNDPAVSNGDDFESMKKRAKSKGFTFPYLFDDGQKVFPKFGATRTPHVFILKNEKKLENRFPIDLHEESLQNVYRKCVPNCSEDNLRKTSVQGGKLEYNHRKNKCENICKEAKSDNLNSSKFQGGQNYLKGNLMRIFFSAFIICLCKRLKFNKRA